MKAFQSENLTDNFNFFLPSNYVNRFNFYLYKEITTLDKHVTNKGYHGREAALMPVPRPNINKLSQPLRDAYKHTWRRNNKIAEIQQDKLVVNIIDPPTLMDLHTNPYITLDTGQRHHIYDPHAYAEGYTNAPLPRTGGGRGRLFPYGGRQGSSPLMSRAVPWAPLCGQPKNTISETQDIPGLLPEATGLDDDSL